VARKRIAVLVPGILGSILVDAGGGEIWSENFYRNYRNLLNNPALLNWSGIKATARLLRDAHFGHLNWMSLWKAIHKSVQFPADFDNPARIHEFGYDWRQSNVHSAHDLADWLTRLLGTAVDKPPSSKEERRLTFIMHSMGGIVVRLAIATRVIDLGWVDRMIHIGSPLAGAPSAFGSLFGTADILPLLWLLLRARHLKNRDRFLYLVQTCIGTCDSTYELLPRAQQLYIHYSILNLTNPLLENFVDPRHRQLATNAHALLDQAITMIRAANVPSFAIYTYSHPTQKTNIDYRVESRTGGYRILETTGMTAYGDGTVPEASARGDASLDRPLPLFGATHAVMCRDLRVGPLVQSTL
jgi:hypothetical protein